MLLEITGIRYASFLKLAKDALQKKTIWHILCIYTMRVYIPKCRLFTYAREKVLKYKE